MIPTDAGMRAWRAFLEAHAAISKKMEEDLRQQCDLQLSWYDALVQLHECGGSLRMHELADRMLLSRSATTRFADRLESAGFIARSSARADRRGTIVTLTAVGLSELKRTAPVHLRGIAEYFDSQFTTEELQLIEKLFVKLSNQELMRR